MQQTLLITGLTCLIAAIVGGGLKAFGIEIPLLSSRVRQVVLGLFGLILIAVGLFPLFPPGSVTVYEDNVPDTNSHGIRFLELTAKSVHNPPKVNERIRVEFTLQNAGDKPVDLLGIWVTAYDPSGRQKDFAYQKVNRTILPQERITTSGERTLDAAGTWELGPHYALGKKWDGEGYPGHWKRFHLAVMP